MSHPEYSIHFQQETAASDSIKELAAYTALSATLMAVLYYLVYFDPTTYVHMVTEDRFGEWFTAVAYALTSLILAFLAWKHAAGVKRLLWSLMALVLFLLSAEEISWGQRVFHFHTPKNLVDLNLQSEMNLHNLAVLGDLNSTIYNYLLSLLILWIAFSLIVKLRAPGVNQRLLAWGIPVYPLKLLPVLALPVWMWTVFPPIKSDETGEFMLSLAIFLWAVDAFSQRVAPRAANNNGKLVTMALLLAVAVTLLACWQRPGSLRYRLNNLAADSYPGSGMYTQAEVLFQYIYAHPEHLTVDTRINHGRMLMQQGDTERAASVLEEARREVADSPNLDVTEKKLRNAVIASILGDHEMDIRLFGEINQDMEQQLAASSSDTERVTLMFRKAKILEARGDYAASAAATQAAKDEAKRTGVKVSRLR